MRYFSPIVNFVLKYLLTWGIDSVYLKQSNTQYSQIPNAYKFVFYISFLAMITKKTHFFPTLPKRKRCSFSVSDWIMYHKTYTKRQFSDFYETFGPNNNLTNINNFCQIRRVENISLFLTSCHNFSYRQPWRWNWILY